MYDWDSVLYRIQIFSCHKLPRLPVHLLFYGAIKRRKNSGQYIEEGINEGNAKQ